MKCEEVMEYMQRCLDMDLTDVENAAMQEHMKTCTSCAEMFERLNHLSEELVKLPKIAPPYSIVDSILPRLDEIDEQATTAIVQPEPISKWREFRNSVSFRVLGGMAAAIVFVVIAVNQFPQFMGQDGSGDLAYFNSANSDSGDDSASGAEMESNMATESIMMADEAPAEDQRSSFTQKDEGESAPDAAPPASDAPDAGGGVPEGGYGITGGVPEEAPTDSSEAAAPEEPVPDARMMDAPSLIDDKGSLKVEFNESLPEMVTEPIPSPEGTYTAWVEQTDRGYQVVITDAASGDRLYASPVKQADAIQELTWSQSEDTLSYTTVTGESSAQFTINVELREESQL